MKKTILLLIVVVSGWVTVAAAGAEPALPKGALVYAEVADLQGALALWDASPIGKAWEGSPAAYMFERSRLYLKYMDKLGELETLTGADLDGGFLRGLAGGRTVLALFDPGKREILLVTFLPGASAPVDALAALLPEATHLGVAYRGKRSEDGRSFVGLYRRGNELYLSNSERILKEAIRVAKEGGGYALPAFGAAGNVFLRVDVNLAAARKTPQFRKYWLFPGGGRASDKPRLLLSVQRDGNSWVEDRFFPAGEQTTPAAAPAAVDWPDLGPFCMVRPAARTEDWLPLFLGGILHVSSARQTELSADARYAGAAFGLAAGEETDFDKRLDAPPAGGPGGVLAGAKMPLEELKALAGEAEIRGVRWVWDMSRAGAPIAWNRQEGALALEYGKTGINMEERLRKLTSRILAGAYLCQPRQVEWGEPDSRSGRGCRYPMEVWIKALRPGVVLLATSTAMMERLETLCGVTVDAGQAFRLRLAEAGERYVTFLKDSLQPPETKAEESYQFMRDVVPALAGSVPGLTEIRKVSRTTPEGLCERVTYVVK